MKETQTYISAHQDRFLTELLEFLRSPSISADPANAGSVRQAAEWMAQNLKKQYICQIPKCKSHNYVSYATIT
jgi:acetylornithine deacetylase/succinyl-diaminopimelate desuccinylase-like protein